MPTILKAGGASDSLDLSGSNDGALIIQTGPSGAKVNALAFASDGTPTYLKTPVLPAASMVRVNTSNGYGSTSTTIRRFTTILTNQGTDITYADSATLGGTFTINTAGVYSITYADQANALADFGLSLNSAQLTTIVASITTSTRLIMATSPGASSPVAMSWTGVLSAADVVRAHTGASTSGGEPGETTFTIVRVA